MAKAKRIEEDKELSKLGTCMVKTHLSLSDNPMIKGVPKAWKLHIRDILTYQGAGFVVPVAGTISLMPGTASDPAFRRVDVRLAHCLLARADAAGLVSLTHQELAAELGTAREVVSRQLKEFERRGWLHAERGAVHLVERAAIAELAADAGR